MRYLLPVSFFLMSLTSFSTTINLRTDGDYNLTASVPTGSMSGDISASTPEGQCDGYFEFDFSTYTIQIDFGSGDCANNSMTVYISSDSVFNLLGGYEVPVTFKANRFGYRPHNGYISMS